MTRTILSDTIFIAPYNSVHIFVTSNNDGIEYELSNHFSFAVPGRHFMPAFKNGIWDGVIRLYNSNTKLIYRGLLNRIIQWADEQNYTVELDKDLRSPNETKPPEHYQKFIDGLNLPFEPRDYQFSSFVSAIEAKRQTILSPTGSGKSLLLYLITRYLNNKTLLIVPNVNLIHQMNEDFQQYGYQDPVHLIYSGKDKETETKITISTWQSIYRLPKDWFLQFETILIDEVHLAKAKSLTSILEKMVTTNYRFGTTGTLDGSETNRLVIEGLLGPVEKKVSTSKLMDDEILARLNIQSIVIKYPEDLVEVNKKNTYHEEVDLIVTNKQRNNFILKLVKKVPGNNLVLFNFIKHGRELEELFKNNTDRKVFYIDGSVDPKIRNDIRGQIEQETDCIIVASTKAFATGTNIIKLNNIFFTSPSKARIQTLQSIGRVLRKSNTKTHATLFDIADDISWLNTKRKKKYNYTMLHFFERIKIYKQENFSYQIRNINLPKEIL